MRRALRIGVLLAILASAGCGGSSSGHTPSAARVTLPAYAGYRSATETVTEATQGRSRFCRADAQSFARNAELFVAHYGPSSAYPADLFYMNLRTALTDFQGRKCNPADLGRVLRRRLTAGQRATLLSDLPRVIASAVADTLRGK